MTFIFEKLNVYQKSLDFADKVSQTTQSFPRGSYYLADQLNRASLSIAADIAEGNGRFTKANRQNDHRPNQRHAKQNYRLRNPNSVHSV